MSKTLIKYGRPVPMRIDPELLRRIEALSIKLGENKSTVMRICMRVGLNAVQELADRDPKVLVAQLMAATQRHYPPPTEDEEQIRIEDKPQKRKAS